MSDSEQLIVCVAVLFVSTLVRSTFGFGDALIAMPVLTLALGPRAAAPVVAIASAIPSFVIAATDRGDVSWSEAGRLMVAAAIGVPFGVYLLRTAPELVLQVVLGVLVVVYAVWALVWKPRPGMLGRGWVWPFGIVSGLLGAATTSAGPPAAIYAILRGFSPAKFRATLQAYFMAVVTMIVIGHATSGLWAQASMRLVPWSVPGILVAIWLGGLLNKRITAERFHRALHAMLLVLGVLLLRPLVFP